MVLLWSLMLVMAEGLSLLYVELSQKSLKGLERLINPTLACESYFRCLYEVMGRKHSLFKG